MVGFVPFINLNIGVLFYEQIQILDSFVLSRNVNIGRFSSKQTSEILKKYE